MNQDRNTEHFTRQTVLNFRFFDERSLSALAADLSLSLAPQQLFLCRDHFLMREHRDPTVGELRFLDALATFWLQMPEAEIIDGITSEQSEQNRTFADLLHKSNALPGVPARSIPDLMDVAGRYLSRAGITPFHDHLLCGHPASLAALCAGAAPALTLDLGDTAAMLAPPPAKRYPLLRNLFLLLPTGNEPFPVEVARFFAAHRHLELFPVSAPLDEGLFPHLLSLGGLMLDATPLATYRPEIGPASLLSFGVGTVLFLAPDRALPRFYAEQAPVLHCGTLNGSRLLQIRRNNELLLSISLDLLYALRQCRKVSPTLTAHDEKQIKGGITTARGTMLGGITATGGCGQALVSLIGEMAQKGALLSRSTASAVLELPQAQPCGAAAGALPLLLDYHRILTELALPSCHHCHLTRNTPSEPRLSVFIAATQGAARDAGFEAAWQSAAKARDFAAIRALLYQ